MTLTVNNVGDNPQIPGVSAESYIPDQLIAGDFKLVTDNFTVPSGTIVFRGTPVGVVTATGKIVSSVRTATDGSQNPIGIAAVYTDASSTGPQGAVDANSGVYLTGEFNVNAVMANTDSSWTAAQLKAALRPLSIFLKTVVTASDPT